MDANERIVTKLVPEWVSHQLEKSRDYNGSGIENADVLGVKGQFADVWRKIWKLKKGMWDGEALVGEQPREILLDLIGHAFLAIDMIDRDMVETLPTAERDWTKPPIHCGMGCTPRHHVLKDDCRYRLVTP